MSEFTIKSMAEITGIVFSVLFGGWSPLLGVLLWMVVIDFASGTYVAYSQKLCSRHAGFKGVLKKMLIFAMVVVAHKLDTALELAGILLRVTLLFYIANEGQSIIKNMARAGIPVPGPLRYVILKKCEQASSQRGRQRKQKDRQMETKK